MIEVKGNRKLGEVVRLEDLPDETETSDREKLKTMGKAFVLAWLYVQWLMKWMMV